MGASRTNSGRPAREGLTGDRSRGLQVSMPPLHCTPAAEPGQAADSRCVSRGVGAAAGPASRFLVHSGRRAPGTPADESQERRTGEEPTVTVTGRRGGSRDPEAPEIPSEPHPAASCDSPPAVPDTVLERRWLSPHGRPWQ